MTLPRKLNVFKKHPDYDEHACMKVDKVFCDGEHIKFCAAYNMDEGWAIPRMKGYNGPKIFGEITVTEKMGPKI